MTVRRDSVPAATVAAAPIGGTLDAWLDWQMHLHSHEIELGLERVREVAMRLQVLPPNARSIIIAGTNGKGSCARLSESLLRNRGHHVGTYTSPHLWRYNERVRIDGAEADDAALCAAFEAVESARGSVSLTYFEYGTLAALWLFKQARVNYAVLEVGMGGRLDAVNIIDADVALITNIGLDHAAWLGNTRDAIGREKAGVMRSATPVVCADRQLPESVTTHANAIGADMYRIGTDFDIRDHGWHGWTEPGLSWVGPLPAHILKDNLAAVLAVMVLLDEQPESPQAVMRACNARRALHGRREVVAADSGVPVIFDVCHNAEATAVLSAWLREHPVDGDTHTVLGMLSDKPVEAVAAQLAPVTDHFYAADLSAITPRGLTADAVAARLGHDAVTSEGPYVALARARVAARPGDRIVVCGSFHTVANARVPEA